MVLQSRLPADAAFYSGNAAGHMQWKVSEFDTKQKLNNLRHNDRQFKTSFSAGNSTLEQENLKILHGKTARRRAKLERKNDDGMKPVRSQFVSISKSSHTYKISNFNFILRDFLE